MTEPAAPGRAESEASRPSAGRPGGESAGPGREAAERRRIPLAGDEPIRVTTLELFFDLVFAFTLTQLSALLHARLTIAHGVQVLLIFGLLWWMYAGYAWLTNTRSPVLAPERLLLVIAMAGFLVVGLAIPRSFGPDGVLLGIGYLVVVCVHAGLYARLNRNIFRVAPFNVLSALLVIGAGLAGGAAGYGLWAAALLVQAGSPLIVHPGGRFEVGPAHFAERHGALVIVAIGESVAAIGAGAHGLALRAGLVLASVTGLALAAVLWWAYFGNGDDERGEQAMTAAAPPARAGLALTAYFYAHMPLLLGIVGIATGVRAAIADPGTAQLGAACALGAGGCAFAAGTAAFRLALHTGPVQLRLLAAAFALCTVALGATVAIEAQVIVLTAALAVMLAAERRSGSPG
jgi:low temperature requirement protein LtrA